MTRKRIVGFTGTALATLGFIILLAGWAQAGSKWDDNNCCKNACKFDGVDSACNSGCVSNDSVFQEGSFTFLGTSIPCCYSVSASGPSALILICGIIAIAAVVLTVLILECGDKICCECCQKCTAIILGIQNLCGLIFAIVLVVVLAATDGGSGGQCSDTTVYTILGVNAVMIAGTVFLILGCICSVIVTFIECCCDDSADVGGAATAST